MTDADTSPDHSAPSEAEDILSRVIRRELAPILDAVAELRADLGLANGSARSVLRRLTDVEERVSDLEIAAADTERPSYTDSAEPGGES